MSTVEEITQAIATLPKEEFWKLTDKLLELRDETWDREMNDDALAGRLDNLWLEATKEIAAGETISMDDFLRHQNLPR